MKRVVITGLGCITPIGTNISEFEASLFAGRTGIAEFGLLPEAVEGQNGIKFNRMASVVGFDPDQHLSTGVVTATNRTTQFAIVAARQAAAQSDLIKHYALKTLPSSLAAPAAVAHPKKSRPPSSTTATPASTPSPLPAPWPRPAAATSPSISASPAPS